MDSSVESEFVGPDSDRSFDGRSGSGLSDGAGTSSPRRRGRSIPAALVSLLVVALLAPLAAPAGALAVDPAPAMSAPDTNADPAPVRSTIGPLGSGVLAPGITWGNISSSAPSSAAGTAPAADSSAIPVTATPVESGEFAIDLVSLGAQTLARGAAVPMMLITGIKGDPTTGVTEFIELPAGVTMDPVDSAGWLCTGGAVRSMCRHASALAGSGGELITITLRALTNAPLGDAGIHLSATTDDGRLRADKHVAITIGEPSQPTTPTATTATGSSSSTGSSSTTGSPSEPTSVTSPATMSAGSTTDTPVSTSSWPGDPATHVPLDIRECASTRTLSEQHQFEAMQNWDNYTSTCTAPGIARNVFHTFVRGATSDSATITWDAPVSNGGAPIIRYEVDMYWNADSSGSSPVVDPTLPRDSWVPATAWCIVGDENGGIWDSTPAPRTCTITDLPHGVDGYFIVSASNWSANGDASGPSSEIAVPGAPTDVVGVSGASSVQVSWTAPATTGGKPITRYVVTSSTGPSGVRTCTATTGTTCTVTGLTNGTSYTFTVVAHNATGDSLASAPSAAVVPSRAPTAPLRVTAGDGATPATGTAVVSWSPPTFLGDGTVTYTVSSSAGPSGVRTCTTTSTTCSVTGLSDGSTYSFTVRATNASGTGVASAASASFIPGLPGAPAAPTVSLSDFEDSFVAGVKVAWNPPAYEGAGAVTSYTVQAYQHGVAVQGGSCVTATTSCVVRGLDGGTTYTFTVTAMNPIGSGLASAQSPAIMFIDYPGWVGNVVGTPGPNSVKVTWTAPTSTGGGPITGYRVIGYTFTVVGGTVYTPGCSAGAAVLTCTVHGLPNGVPYDFFVYATNSNPYITSLDHRFGATPGFVPTPIGLPSAPTTVSILQQGEGIHVDWHAADPAEAVISHLVTITDTSTGRSVSHDTTSGMPYWSLYGELTAGTTYRMTIAARNAAGYGPASAVVIFHPVTTAPAPTAVVGTFGDHSVLVSWTAPTNIASYYSADSYYLVSTPDGPSCVSERVTSCRVEGLENGVTYTFTVRFVNNAGDGTASSASAGVAPGTIPTAPQGVAVTAANASIRVAWAPSADPGGRPILGYIATTSVGSTGARSCRTTGSTSCTITGLVGEETYTVTVVARTALGTSPGTTSAEVVPLGSSRSPVDVVGVSGPGSVTVSWSAPPPIAGISITGYTVRSTPGDLTCSTTGELTCVVSGLTNGVAHTFVVTATTSDSRQTASFPSAAVIPARAPDAPSDASGTVSGSSVLVQWSAPTDTGGSPVTSYIVTSSPGSRSCSTAALNCVITGLTLGTHYTFTIVAVSAAGRSVSSSPTGDVVPMTAPSTPTAVRGISGNRSVTVLWAPAYANGSPITGYIVDSSPASAGCVGGASATMCVVNGLANGVSYTFTVRATNAVGDSRPGSGAGAIVPASVPDVPTSVVGSIAGAGAVSVSWDAPSDDGGAPIIRSSVVASPGGRGCTAVGTLHCTVTGLLSSVSYTFTVTATTRVGSGAPSVHSDPITAVAAAGPPLRVTAVFSRSSATVSWLAPVSTGGAPITRYTVTSNIGGLHCTSGTTSCVVTDLLPGVVYSFIVVATTAAGDGAISASSNSGTAIPAAGAPVSINTTAGPGAVTISWSRPADGTTILSYTVTASPSGRTCTIAVRADATGASCTIGGLTPGVSSTFSVTATDAGGPGVASAASAPVVPFTSAGAVSGVVATAGSERVTVSWSALVEGAASGWSSVVTYTVVSTSGGFTCTTTTTSCDVLGLVPGTAYSFRVHATTAAGAGADSAATSPVTPFTVPGSPTAVAIDLQGDSAIVSWTAPVTDGGSTIVSYTVTASTGETCTTSSPSERTCTIAGIDPGFTDVTVVATNAAGDSLGAVASETGTVPESLDLGGVDFHITTATVRPGGLLVGAGTLTIGSTTIVLAFQFNVVSRAFSATGSVAIGPNTTITGSFSYDDADGWSASFSHVPAECQAIGAGLSICALAVSMSSTPGDTAPMLHLEVSGELVISGVNRVATTFEYTDAANWSLTLAGTVGLGFGSVDLAGTVSYDDGVLTGALCVASVDCTTAGTGSVALRLGRVSMSGVTFTGLALIWTPTAETRFTISASISFSEGSNVTVTGTYADATHWQLTASNVTFRIASGISLSASALTIGRAGGAMQASGAATLAVAGTSVAVTFTYVNGTNWKVAVTLTASLTLFGSSAVVSGSIEQHDATLTQSIRAVFAPIRASGLTVSNLTVSWTSTAGLTGTGTIDLGAGVVLSVDVAYTDSNNWSLTARTSPGTLTIAPGFTLAGAALVGAITNTSGSVVWGISATVSRVALISDVLTLKDITVSVGSACPQISGTAFCPSGTNSTYLSLTGSVVVSLGSGLGTQTIDVVGVYGTQSKGFRLQASMTKITIVPGFLEITAPTLSVAYSSGAASASTGSVGLGVGAGSKGGYSFAATGTANVLGASLPVTFTYTATGYAVVGSFPSAGLTLGTARLTSLAYTDVASTVTLDGSGPQLLPARTLAFGGAQALPTWVATLIGRTLDDAKVFVTYSGATDYMIRASFPTSVSVPTGSSSYRFSFGNFTIMTGFNSGQPVQSLSQSGTFTISAAGSSTKVIDVAMGVTYLASSQTVNGFISAAGANGGSLWDNAFGLTGFSLRSITIQVGIQIAAAPFPLPTLGLQATVTLPGNLLTALGMRPTDPVPVSVLMQLSEANPCMDIAVGTSGGPDIVNIAGVLKAKYFHLVIAPTGCVVGTTVVPAGFAVQFEGSLLDVPLGVSAVITTTPTFRFLGSASVGAFRTGPVTFDGATISVGFDSAQGTSTVQFAGSLKVLDVAVSLSGLFSWTSSTQTSVVRLTGSVGNISAGPFSLTNLQFAGELSTSPSAQSFSLQATGRITILGSVLDVRQVAFTYVGGRVTALHIDVAATIVVSSVTISGTFVLDTDRTSGVTSLTATGTANVSGFNVGSVALTIDDRGFAFTGTLTVPGVFSTSIAGAMYWQTPLCPNSVCPNITLPNGSVVRAVAGDFAFSASGIGFTIGGFSATASVSLARAGGTFGASFSGSFAVDNRGSGVTVQGSFTSSGDFSARGTATALAGFNLTLDVSASKIGSAVSVSATANVSISGFTVRLSGSFARSAAGVTSTLAVTTAATIGGFNLGTSTFRLSIAPGVETFTFSSSVSAGPFAGSMSGTFGRNSGAVTFDFTAWMSMNSGGVSGSGTFRIQNTSGSVVASISGVSLSISGATYSFPSITFSAGFSFSASASNSFSGSSSDGWSKDLPWPAGSIGYTIKASFSGSYSASISWSASTGFRSSVSASATARAEYRTSVDCRNYCSLGSYSASLSASGAFSWSISKWGHTFRL